MRLAYLVAGYMPLLGQTSRVIKAPGDKVTLEISAHSQPSRAPIALKWELVFPAQLIEIESDATEVGSVANASGKLLQCTARRPYIYTCILSGGQVPIADGLIATFHFRVPATVKAAIITLKIQKAEATTADSTQAALNDTESVVVIR